MGKHLFLLVVAEIAPNFSGQKAVKSNNGLSSSVNNLLLYPDFDAHILLSLP